MVVGFAKDKLQLSEAELARLTLDIHEGDLSVVLREYEKEIKVRSE
jgi:nuclear-control-of-ATPase protein 2